MNLSQAIESVTVLNQQAITAARERWSSIAKPLGSLGFLEDCIVTLAGIQGTSRVDLNNRTVVVMCADNGVVAEGVTQTGSEVTAIVAGNFVSGKTSVCAMARQAKAVVLPIDVGMLTTVPGVRQMKTMNGTCNMAKEPAMTREAAIHAIEAGIQVVEELQERGNKLLATGEMGIGNTTTSSAIAAVLLQQPVEVVTGKGAGLSSQGLERKIQVIKQAIACHQPNPTDPLDVLAKVGGLDIAGLVGVYLGAAVTKTAVLVDGFISSVAALLAIRLCPLARQYMLASHVSNEPAGRLLIDALALQPFLYANMCLGEGTGAVAILPILDMANAVYSEMSTFAEIDIDAYEDLNGVSC